MRMKLIKTESEHREALAEFNRLALSNPAPGEPEADRLEVLALLVENYEDKMFPIPVPDPIEAIKFRMDQLGLARKDLEQYLGGRSHVSEVLNHKRPLSAAMVRKLRDGLKIPADILINGMA